MAEISLWWILGAVAPLSLEVLERGCIIYKMNSGARDAAQTGHKRQATKTGRHVVTQGSLGDGGVLRRRGEPELGRNLFRRRELQRD